MSVLTPRSVDAIIRRGLDEDLASGDLTSESCVEPNTQAAAVALAKDDLVVCGGLVFQRAFELVDAGVTVSLATPDGTRVAKGTEMWRVSGAARSLLAAERVALNFVQRMSGIATLARSYVDAVPNGCSTRITDTRKTTPGLRHLERYAVRTGGAHNHRDNLGSAVMIKDNHIAAAGGVEQAIRRAQSYAPHTSRIEVEVTTLEQFDLAVAQSADVIMLDNMDTDTIREAVARIAERRGTSSLPIIEASGNITLERIAALARAGVDVISSGALTHSAPAADISLELGLSAP